MYELLKCDIMNENFRKLINSEKSGWLKDAKRRQRWGWFTKLTLKPRIKYYRLKRAFLLFIHNVSKVEQSETTVCDNCTKPGDFYLGTTCPKCKKPFRSAKQTGC